ncbi:MAG: hypothetical protein J7M26_05240 [Armatimonadetes bacterium]|nr:hypothetical protein [Armatimonadota bacterium]
MSAREMGAGVPQPVPNLFPRCHFGAPGEHQGLSWLIALVALAPLGAAVAR